jgi:hypothetical protein
MMERNFHPQWIAWIMGTVKRGKVCVNVNGERSKFFSTYRGLETRESALSLTC